jgi:hypothetical protein
MIFLGDVAVPFVAKPKISAMPWGATEPVIANLEGAYSAAREVPTWQLCNSSITEEVIQRCGITAVTLANNHIMDMGTNLRGTYEWLSRQNVGYFGAGDNFREASAPIFLDDNGHRIGLIGFGWHVIGCRPASVNSAGCNRLDPAHVLASVDHFFHNHSDAKLILFMHWDYELETYPQPMHRQLAHSAIDRGVSAVIGCHSHCIQGIEYYRDAPIVYGLGNWFLSEGVFKKGALRFPEISKMQIAFEWKNDRLLDRVHLFRFDADREELTLVKSSAVLEMEEVTMMSQFVDMSHSEYVAWFRENRRKRKLLPVYKDYRSARLNSIFDFAVWTRQKVIEAAVQLNLKRGPK